MRKTSLICLIFFSLLILHACKSSSKTQPLSVTKGEYIYRHDQEILFDIEPLTMLKRQAYPWEISLERTHPKITKEFFRCKGHLLNPVKIVEKGGEKVHYYDCGGAQRHSLPIRNQKEFIYPILINLLNYLQKQTGKKVIVTCGHCCPEHNLYLNAAVQNQASKHQLGAEVDFYVEGMENEPEKIVQYLQNYYKEDPKYKNMKEYVDFERFKGEKTNVSIDPWFNKEIFIKLVKSHEGRDADNCHTYAYVSVQVRYDEELQEKVTYSWDKAFRNFYRR